MINRISRKRIKGFISIKFMARLDNRVQRLFTSITSTRMMRMFTPLKRSAYERLCEKSKTFK
jgi:hypothetical protein